MAETVNTSALLLSDGQGGYSKAFMESMTDIVKLQNGSSLTEKLAEIDGKLPITLTSGTLPETLVSGRLLVNGSDFYLGNSSSQKVQIARVDQIPQVTQYVHPSAIQCNAASEINSLKSSVSSGKQSVANAITGKGVSASQNDSFATLANKISQIRTPTAMADNFINAAYVDDDWSFPYITFDECPGRIATRYNNGDGEGVYFDYTSNDYGSGPRFSLMDSRDNIINGSSVSMHSNIKKPEFTVTIGYSTLPLTIPFYGHNDSQLSTITFSNAITKNKYIQDNYVYEEVSIPISAKSATDSKWRIELSVNEITMKFHWYFQRSMRASVTVRYP